MSTLKVGNKNVLQVYCGNETVKEVVYGDTVMYYIPDISYIDRKSSHNPISDYTATGYREDDSSKTKTQFIYQDNTDLHSISVTNFTDAELSTLQEVLDQSRDTTLSGSKSYKFNCAYSGRINLPQWVRDRLQSGATVTCNFKADLWAKTTVNGNISSGYKGYKPGETQVFLLLRQNNTTAGDTGAISTKISSGQPEIKTGWTIPSNSLDHGDTITHTVVLRQDTTSITWGCMFDAIRINQSKATDSKHEATFSNISITFTIN